MQWLLKLRPFSLALHFEGGMQMHIDHLYDLWLSSWLCVKVKFDFLPALAIRFSRVRAARPIQSVLWSRCIEPTCLHNICCYKNWSFSVTPFAYQPAIVVSIKISSAQLELLSTSISWMGHLANQSVWDKKPFENQEMCKVTNSLYTRSETYMHFQSSCEIKD